MKIWKIKGNINGRCCFNVEELYDDLYDFHNKGFVDDWRGLKVSFISHKKRRDILPLKNITVFTSFSFLFVCDEYSKEKISQKYDCIQFLPVSPIERDMAETSNYYLPNVLNIVSGLDEEKSKFRYIAEKYISGVEEYYFSDEVKKYPIFYIKVKEHTFLDLFVTDEFKDYVEVCGITGFTFTEVFDFEKEIKSKDYVKF